MRGGNMASLGSILSEARIKAGISKSDAAAATRLKIQILDALESEDFSRIPAPVYGKGFIKLYAEYLGLDPVPLITEYMSRAGTAPMPSLMTDPSKTVRFPVAVDEDETSGGDGNVNEKAPAPVLDKDYGVEEPASDRGRFLAIAAVVAGVAVVVLLILQASSYFRGTSSGRGGRFGAADPASELPDPYFRTNTQ